MSDYFDNAIFRTFLQIYKVGIAATGEILLNFFFFSPRSFETVLVFHIKFSISRTYENEWVSI